MAGGEKLPAALARLDEVTRRLRVTCPWDIAQDERSIVPHTVEEAYELAEAARRNDFAAMRDELGDVLFQVVFLALLLEERGEGDLPSVADGLTEKLIRRHPHVFPPEGPGPDGSEEIETADDVRRQWDEIKRDVEGRTSEDDWKKPGLPALIFANKVQWKLDPGKRPANAGAESPDRDRAEREIGELLWSAVEQARSLGVDPELALRTVAERHAVERS
ncbi:MAG: nucleoside triphosphate pyrophosphohydrolase [Solirubrobacterales bacterium]|nr:nucleoside triphosphate pyrophosphohydrolase [Solirubrobacterales bacterium]